MKKEKEQQTQQAQHVEAPKEEQISQDETTPRLKQDVKSLDDSKTQDGKTPYKLIPLSVTNWNKALDQEPCDLIFETPVGLAAQLSCSGLLTPERQKPKYGAVLPGKAIKGKVAIFHVETGQVALCWNLWILVGLLVRSIYRHLQEIERQETRKEE